MDAINWSAYGSYVKGRQALILEYNYTHTHTSARAGARAHKQNIRVSTLKEHNYEGITHVHSFFNL